MFYSKTTKGFYNPLVHGADMPDDAVEITADQYRELLRKQDLGCVIDADMSGKPVAIAPQPPPVEDVLAQVKNELRPLRNSILAEVVQIALVARDAGDNALADEVLAPFTGVRDRLRDITQDPALNAAQSREAMQAAVRAYYDAMVASVSPAIKPAFNELEN